MRLSKITGDVPIDKLLLRELDTPHSRSAKQRVVVRKAVNQSCGADITARLLSALAVPITTFEDV